MQYNFKKMRHYEDELFCFDEPAHFETYRVQYPQVRYRLAGSNHEWRRLYDLKPGGGRLLRGIAKCRQYGYDCEVWFDILRTDWYKNWHLETYETNFCKLSFPAKPIVRPLPKDPGSRQAPQKERHKYEALARSSS